MCLVAAKACNETSSLGLALIDITDDRVFVWDREARHLAILEHSVSGCVSDVSWHPNDPTIFASGGDDGTLCM